MENDQCTCKKKRYCDVVIKHQKVHCQQVLHETHKSGKRLEFLQGPRRTEVAEVGAVQLGVGDEWLHPLINFAKDTCNDNYLDLTTDSYGAQHSLVPEPLLSDFQRCFCTQHWKFVRVRRQLIDVHSAS